MSSRTSSLSVNEKAVLRHALLRSSYFIHVLVAQFFDSEPIRSEKVIEDLYSRFVNFIFKSSSSFPTFSDILRRSQAMKRQEITLRRQLMVSRRKLKVFIHRFDSLPVSDHPAFGKIVVINPKHPERYCSNKYYIMESQKSYVVHPTQYRYPEAHLMVCDDAPPNHEIMRLSHDSFGTEDTPWLLGAALYNGFVHNTLASSLKAISSMLRKNIAARRNILRGKGRKGIGKAIGIGSRKDRHGQVGRYSNFAKGRMKEDQKITLNVEADEAIDITLTVIIPQDRRLTERF